MRKYNNNLQSQKQVLLGMCFKCHVACAYTKSILDCYMRLIPKHIRRKISFLHLKQQVTGHSMPIEHLSCRISERRCKVSKIKCWTSYGLPWMTKQQPSCNVGSSWTTKMPTLVRYDGHLLMPFGSAMHVRPEMLFWSQIWNNYRRLSKRRARRRQRRTYNLDKHRCGSRRMSTHSVSKEHVLKAKPLEGEAADMAEQVSVWGDKVRGVAKVVHNSRRLLWMVRSLLNQSILLNQTTPLNSPPPPLLFRPFTIAFLPKSFHTIAHIIMYLFYSYNSTNHLFLSKKVGVDSIPRVDCFLGSYGSKDSMTY